MEIKVDEIKCIGCGDCVDICPVDAIKVDDIAEIDEDECIECESCIEECPEKALSIQ